MFDLNTQYNIKVFDQRLQMAFYWSLSESWNYIISCKSLKL